MPREPKTRDETASNVTQLAGAHPTLVRVAAKLRLLEQIVAGDARILVSEARADVEALVGPGAEIVPIKRKK